MKSIKQKLHARLCGISTKLYLLAHDERGDFGIWQMVGIIAAVVGGGILIKSVRDNLPTLFDGLFGEIKGKLDANW